MSDLPNSDSKREFFRHTLATLAYRGGKAIRNAPEEFAEFRAGEARVIARLLESGTQVIATGGGAFMNADTRAAIKAKGISVWLMADFDVLMRRIKRRNDRPLLKIDDPEAKLRELIDLRYPTYALADLTVQSRDVVHEKIVDECIDALRARLCADAPSAQPTTDGISVTP